MVVSALHQRLPHFKEKRRKSLLTLLNNNGIIYSKINTNVHLNSVPASPGFPEGSWTYQNTAYRKVNCNLVKYSSL